MSLISETGAPLTALLFLFRGGRIPIEAAAPPHVALARLGKRFEYFDQEEVRIRDPQRPKWISGQRRRDG